MIKIIVRNVKSQLTEYTEELERLMTVCYPNYWFSQKFKDGFWDGKHHFLEIPSLKFPTGLLFIIEGYFKDNDIEYEIIDERNPTYHTSRALGVDENLLKGIKLRDYQQEAILKALYEQRGIIEMPTGSGKTAVAAGIIKLLGLKTLYMVHTVDLLHQTIEKLEKRLGLKHKVGIIGDNEYRPSETRVTVATIQTLDSRLKNDFKKTKDFLNTFKILIQDECHHSSAQSWYKLGMFCHGAYFRYGLSGTALRRDVLSNMKSMAVIGKSIYQKKTRVLQKEGYLSNIRIEMIRNPEIVPSEKYQRIYSEGIVKSIDRNSMIASLAHQQFINKKRVMILVRHIAQGQMLHRMLTQNLNAIAAFLYGEHDSEIRKEVKEQFDTKGDFILIASPIFDEGIDIPQVNVLIIGSGGKSEWKTIQKIGRGLRKTKDGEPLVVYDFYDHSKFLREHSEERMRIYKQEGFL